MKKQTRSQLSEWVKMENYKVKVNNEAESKEVQELFFELGYRGEFFDMYSYPQYLGSYKDYTFTNYLDSCKLYEWKLITIPQLRDLVVLKRNDVGDAQFIDDSMYKWYVASDGKRYRFQGGKFVYQPYAVTIELNPISKTKEYLDPDNGYALITADDELKGCSNWIEVPEGADFLTKILDYDVFYKEGNPFLWWDGAKWCLCADSVNKEDFKINIWQRHTQPVDEPTPKKHSHYFKDVSDIDEIDVYEILKRFNVTDPCLQHIIKKALCAGQRGHKDMQRDLKDILDTATRAVAINLRS